MAKRWENTSADLRRSILKSRERSTQGENFVVVQVDNTRLADGVPALSTDWWNYGGITRDVTIVEVPATFIENYSLQLAKNDLGRIDGWIQISGASHTAEGQRRDT